jgi:4-amino-4-deoxy-L-arabinose transferase-like glycosyltransferase
MRGVWPFAVAMAIRLGLWLVLSPSRLASDEDSYVRTGTLLLTTGQHDLFWPPVTGWLIALFGSLAPNHDIRVIRLGWIVMDLCCLAIIRVLASRAAAGMNAVTTAQAGAFGNLAALVYAVYLPAISFSQFATSETPALLWLLLSLLLLTSAPAAARHFVGAGGCIGLLAVTRPSLAPLLLFLPAAVVLRQRSRDTWRHATLFIGAGLAVVMAVVLHNTLVHGQFTIAQNSAYNLYIGNRDLYAEDLDLFHPVATAGQIEFRRQFFAGELTYPRLSPDELQREAIAWIRAHPGTFSRRMLGRLARVFAPKTDVLELLGGERAAGIFSAASLALLGLANVQWAIVLFGGLVGLAALWREDQRVGPLFVATVVGSLPLCVIAISKPRYAFTFEPLLLIAAMLLLVARGPVWAALSTRDRWTVVACSMFVLWGWAAWLTFAITSRVGLASTS